MPLGHKYYLSLLRLDLIGIGIMIFGLTICTAYAAMHSYQTMRKTTAIVMGALMLSNFLIQLTPCYGEDLFHNKRVALFIGMLVIDLGIVISMRYTIATEQEIEEIYSKIYWALAYLAIGFFFYVTHTPERFLIKLFGKE
jgi:predicted membrane channel-forming protein YqfA (hemolysin III family)